MGFLVFGVIRPKKNELLQELPQAKCFRKSSCELPRTVETTVSEVVAGRFPKLFPYLRTFPLPPLFLPAHIALITRWEAITARNVNCRELGHAFEY